jgi:hypothetical protein
VTGWREAMGLGVTAAAGAAVMYFLDPDRGRRRRALVRDQVVHAAHRTQDAVDATSRDVANRARGVVADLRGRWRAGEVTDDVLGERVRARVGAVVGHASSIEVAVSDGRVTLSGPVLEDEAPRLLRRVRNVRGVREVEDRLTVHAEPGNVPGLQGRPRRTRGGEVFELRQERWSPAARFLAGFAGALVTVWGLRRGGVIGNAVAAAGLGLTTRSFTNRPIAPWRGLASEASQA